MIRLVTLICSCIVLIAHDRSESYLKIERQGDLVHGRWDVSVQDLELSVGLDADQDDLLTRSEVFSSRPKLEQLLRNTLIFAGQGSAQLEEMEIKERSDGTYLSLVFHAPIRSGSKFAMRYDFMFRYDQEHRAFMAERTGTVENLIVLTADASTVELFTESKGGFWKLVREGVVHIWDGTDHILFLLALLLPAVLLRSGGDTFRCSLVQVLKIVTAFTVAHSITLGLATLEYIRLPSRLVESIIAVSVVLAAANNLRRFWNDRSWILAFGFGLIHGFGFASVLSDLELAKSTLAAGLIGFNLGVEVGQLAIVALFFPVAYFLRESWFYRQVAVLGGSIAILLFALVWVIERAFAVAVFPVASNLPA